jgi:hypothetical protein
MNSASRQFRHIIPYSGTGEDVVNITSQEVGTPPILTYVRSITRANQEIFINGTSIGNLTTTDASLDEIGHNFDIGRFTSATTQYFDGHIGEIIIFNRSLKADERKEIESYLSKK